MISLYSGTVGSGKSYHAVELGLQWVSNKKSVLANFPIKPPDPGKWYMRYNIVRRFFDNQQKYWQFAEEITPEYLIVKSLEHGWFGKESQCLLIIDEAGIPFNSRDWASAAAVRMKWISFFSLSRKLGYDIVLVAQHDRMLDRQIRSLLEYDVKHLKANNSFFLRFLSMFKVTLFLYIYRWYGTKMKANLRTGRYRKSVAERYDTMRMFNMSELLIAIKKIYEGRIVPAPVMAQVKVWEDELLRKLDAEQAEASAVGDDGGPGAEDTATPDEPSMEELVHQFLAMPPQAVKPPRKKTLIGRLRRIKRRIILKMNE